MNTEDSQNVVVRKRNPVEDIVNFVQENVSKLLEMMRNSDLVKLQEEKDNLTKELNDKQETLSLYEGELESLKQQLMEYDIKDKVTLELNNTKEESQNLLKIISEVETACANYRKAVEEKSKQQATIVEYINKEQELKTIINKEREERVKLEKELELKTEALSQANIELQSTKDERDTLVVELQNKTEIIKQMDEDLQIKNSAMLQNKQEYDKELQKQAATIEEIKMELEGKISALAQEKEERANLEAALRKMKRDRDNESEITKEKEINLKAKDEELFREMTNFLQGRNQLEKEKCALQEVINGLEKRIKNIVKEASNIRRDTPELDDNAIMRTPHRELSGHSPILQLHPQTPGYAQDMVCSEPSADSLGPHRELPGHSPILQLHPQTPGCAQDMVCSEPSADSLGPHRELPGHSPILQLHPQTPGCAQDMVCSEPSADSLGPHRELPGHSPILQLHPQTPGSAQDMVCSEPSADSLGIPRYVSFKSRSEALPPASPATKRRMQPDTPPVRRKSARANIAAAPHRELPGHSPILQPQTPGSAQDSDSFSEPSADSLGIPRYVSFKSRSEALPPASPATKRRMQPDTPPVRRKSARANIAAAPHRELPGHSPILQLHPQTPGSAQDMVCSEPSADSLGIPRYVSFKSRSEALPPASPATKRRMQPDTPPVRGKSARAYILL